MNTLSSEQTTLESMCAWVTIPAHCQVVSQQTPCRRIRTEDPVAEEVLSACDLDMSHSESFPDGGTEESLHFISFLLTAQGVQ